MTTSMARSVQKALRDTFRWNMLLRPKNSSALREKTTRNGSMESAGTSEAFLA